MRLQLNNTYTELDTMLLRCAWVEYGFVTPQSPLRRFRGRFVGKPVPP